MTLWPRMTISPTSPCGTSLPSLVDDAHLDALDRRPDRSGLALRVGMVEARPPARSPRARSPRGSCTRTPPRSRASPRPAAPRRRTRRAAGTRRRGLSRSGWWSIAWYIVGTPSKMVTLSRWMISSALPGSKRGIIVRQRADPDARVQPAGLAEGVEQRQRAEEDVVLGAVEQRRHADVAVRRTGCRGSARRPSGCRSCRTCRGSRRCRSRRARPARRPARPRRAAARTRRARPVIEVGARLVGALARGVLEAVPGEQQLRLRSRSR